MTGAANNTVVSRPPRWITTTLIELSWLGEIYKNMPGNIFILKAHTATGTGKLLFISDDFQTDFLSHVSNIKQLD